MNISTWARNWNLRLGSLESQHWDLQACSHPENLIFKKPALMYTETREQSPVLNTDGVTVQRPVSRIVLSIVYCPFLIMVVFKLLSDYQKLTKIRKFSQGPRPKPPPGQLHSLDPACGLSGAATPSNRGLEPPDSLWRHCLFYIVWIVVLKLLSDFQKLSKIGNFFQGLRPRPH